MDMRTRERRGIIACIFAVVLTYLLLASFLGLDLFAHSPYDSYTLQALAWRSGRVSLPRDYSYLELAHYNGNVYVSFPPFPTLIMLPLTFLFGENTPSMLVNCLLFAISGILAYKICRKSGRSPETSALTGFFWVCGCNLLEVSLYGGVWNIAQGASFCLTMGCLRALQEEEKPLSRGRLFLGPVLIACAVGCRPFQAVYVPFVLMRLYREERRVCPSPGRAVLASIPCLIAPALIAAGYGLYNWARFGNILEFGHNYLIEYTDEGGVMLSFSHFLTNLKNVFRLPYIEEHRLMFYPAYGFAFYLCNSAYIISLAETIRRVVRKQTDGTDAVLLLSLFLHFNLMMLHSTMGGWQFGTRYLIDLIPALMYYVLRRKEKLYVQDLLLMGWGIAFNIYGAAVLHTLF